MKVLYFTDAHACPGQNQRRFEWLGNLIVDTQPEVIIQGGDFSTMDSLSNWDKDKRLKIEGRRLKADLDASKECADLLTVPLREYQEAQRRRHDRIYKPKLVWMLGNHDDWLDQYIERNPELEGMFDNADVLPPSYEFTFSEVTMVPWKGRYFLNGTLFWHAPIGRTGPITSKYIATRALGELVSCSVVFGHTHRRQDDTIARYTGVGDLSIIRAVNGGCFFEEWPHYAEDNTNDYWPGVLMFNMRPGGQFTFSEISMGELEELYGNGNQQTYGEDG